MIFRPFLTFLKPSVRLRHHLTHQVVKDSEQKKQPHDHLQHSRTEGF